MADVNVRKRESGKWEYYFECAKVNGKRKKMSKGGFATKKEALKAGVDALNEYNNFNSVFVASEISFSDFLDYFLENYAMLNNKANTIRNYKTLFVRVKEKLGMHKLKNISPEALQNFINELYLEGYSKNYIKQYKTLFSVAFKYAVYPCKYINENPALYITLPKKLEHKEAKRFLTNEEIKSILDYFDEDSNMYVYLQLGFHTGLRRAEIAALTWDDVDFKKQTLTVNKCMIRIDNKWIVSTPKTRSSYRTIKLGDTIIEILRKWKVRQAKNRLACGEFYISNYLDQDNILYNLEAMAVLNDKLRKVDFICTNHYGKTVTSSAARYITTLITKKLNIEFNFHMLRHTHATMLIEGGANMKDVQARLGHSEIATTMNTYAHLTEKMQTQTIDIFEKQIKKNINSK